MSVAVSILLPNLNNRPFLQERVETILAQTWSDWELIVVDNYSDDGAWEFFQELARSEPRVQLRQAPRQGMYVNWNNCLRQARGRFVYIATSDDTMAPNCLEEMVAALESYPECGLAHCRLQLIDQNGRQPFDWWSSSSIFARSSGSLFHHRHIRRAPFDGLLHLTGESVYVSITQLLIRREVFDRVGQFEPRWGSVGDFNWCMRAALTFDAVHVPETWAGWRTHPDQATAAARLGSAEHQRTLDEMIQHAIVTAGPRLSPAIRDQLRDGWEAYAREMRENTWELRSRAEPWSRRVFLLRQLLCGSVAAREHLKARLKRCPDWPGDAPELVRSWLQSLGIGSSVETV